MPETEDIVTRLELCAAIVTGRGNAAMAATMQEAATTIATLRDELKAVTAHCDGLVDEAATLRAEVDGLRADAAAAADLIAEALPFCMVPAMEACREAHNILTGTRAIDAAKAGKEGA